MTRRIYICCSCTTPEVFDIGPWPWGCFWLPSVQTEPAAASVGRMLKTNALPRTQRPARICLQQTFRESRGGRGDGSRGKLDSIRSHSTSPHTICRQWKWLPSLWGEGAWALFWRCSRPVVGQHTRRSQPSGRSHVRDGDPDNIFRQGIFGQNVNGIHIHMAA